MNAPAESEPAETALRVDDLVIDLGRRQVLRGADAVPMAGLTFDLLVALARAAPKIVTYDQLIDRVWPGLVVNPETVSQRVKLLRDALGDDHRAPRYVAGVRGRGYRLLGPVSVLHDIPDNALLRENEDSAHPPDGQPAGESVAHPRGVDARPRNSHAWILAAIAATLLLVVGTVAYFMTVRDRSAAPAALPASQSVAVRVDRTIAVLPFANLSGDAAYEYFSDGLTEELINRLNGLPELHVAARTSSFHFKGRNEPARVIGAQLGVRHLLEGSVRKSGDALRITTQLTNAESGYQLWSMSFDRSLADIFAIQEEIALAVVESLQLTLQHGERAHVARHGTRNPEALDLYMRARQLHQSFELERMEKALAYYREVLELDPHFAAAYVGMADVIMTRRQIAALGPHDPARKEIGMLVRKALEIDPRLGDAHAILAQELGVSFDIAGAERELKIAEQLSPNSEYVLRYLAQFYAAAGGWPQERAVEYARRGQILDPLNPWAITNVGIAYWHTHAYETALQQFDKAIEIDPQFWIAHLLRSYALADVDRYEESLAAAMRAVELSRSLDTLSMMAIAQANAGRRDDARGLLAELREASQQSYWPPTLEGRLLFSLGDRAGALAAFERAYEERDWQLVEALHYRSLLQLQDEPRFQRLIQALAQEPHAALVRRANPTFR